MNLTPQTIRKLITLALLGGLVLTLLISSLVFAAERRDRRQQFQTVAHARVETIRSVWPDLTLPLLAMQSFFNASTEVSRDEFSTFTQTYLNHFPGINFFAWIPAVSEAALQAHEVRGRTAGLERYQIHDLPPIHAESPGPRALHFPLFYMDPFEEHESLLGLDLASDTRIFTLLQKACAQNQMTAQVNPDWLQPEVFSNCISLMTPIYSQVGYTFTPADRQKSLNGFVLLVYDIRLPIESAIALSPLHSVDSVITETTFTGTPEILMVHYAQTRSPETKQPSHLLNNTYYQYEATLRLLDLDIRIRCTPAPTFFYQYPIWKTWVVLAGGFLLTFLLGFGLFQAAQRERRINQVVEERTAALRESEKRFMDVLYASQDAILLIAHEQFVDCNEATVRMLGHSSRDEFLMTHPSELSPPVQPDGRNSFEKANAMMKVAAEKGFHRFEWVHRKAHGEIFPVEVSLTPIVMKQQNILHCVWRDMTQIKQDDQKMRNIFTAVEDYSDGVILTDQDDRALYVNLAFGLRFKYTLEELQTKGVRNLFAEKSIASEVFEKLQVGIAWNSEVNLLTATGETVPILLRGSPTRNEQFAVVGFSFALTDLTERKQIEGQLLQSQKMQSIGQLAAGIAHEINTPIQFIGDNLQFLENSFADLLKLLGDYRKFRESAEQIAACHEFAARISQTEIQADAPYLESEIPKAIAQSSEGVNRVAAIVRAMKEFSHPSQAGKTSVDINHAIETTATIARNEWKYVADLKLNLDRELPNIFCLPGDFNQVMLNLIVNAAHAISDVPKAQEDQRGLITISTRQENQTVVIRVTDSGTGIPEAIRPRIFEPFFTTKEVGRGTGQGLAMVYNVVVKKQGGTIRFETEIGTGTTFILTLPFDQSSSPIMGS